MKPSPGQLANLHGEQNLRAVAGILFAHEFAEVMPSPSALPRDPIASFLSLMRSDLRMPRRAFAGDFPICRNVHQMPFRAHFLLHAPGWPEPMALLGREQTSSGSALEKLEFLYATIRECAPCRCLLLLAGDAFTPAVRARAEQMVARTNGHLARVFHGLTDFRRWLTEGHAYPKPPPSTFA